MKAQVKIAVYVRSNAKGQPLECSSLHAQVERLQEQAQRSDWHVAGVYSDEGQSGKTIHRPELQRMLADIQNRRVEGVMVWSFDQLTRSVLDLAEILRFLEEHNAFLFSMTERLDTSTVLGKALIQMIHTFAEMD